MNKNKGISLVEIVIVISIIVIICAITIVSLSSFKNGQVLRNTAVDIVSMLNKARQNTLSSINSNNYGVHFETNKMTLFIAPTYTQGVGTNEVINFNSVVNIPVSGGINVGGGSDVIFQRLTGETIGGTIVIQQTSNATKQKTITISKTGIISSN